MDMIGYDVTRYQTVIRNNDRILFCYFSSEERKDEGVGEEKPQHEDYNTS